MKHRTLYTITRRNKGAKWAHVQLFQCNGGELDFVAAYKYQPAASAGAHWEALKAYDAAMSTSAATNNRWDVREIEDLR